MDDEMLFDEVTKVLTDLNFRFILNKEALLPYAEQNVKLPDGTSKNVYVVPFLVPIPSLKESGVGESKMYFAYLDEESLKVVFLFGTGSSIAIGYNEDGKAFKIVS